MLDSSLPSGQLRATQERFNENGNNVQNYLSKVTTFFQRLENVLIERKISKVRLAAHLGIAPPAVSRWKDSTPRAETLNEISEWLNVSVNWLLTGIVPEPEAEIVEPITNVKCLHTPQKKIPPCENGNFGTRIAQLEAQVSLLTRALAGHLDEYLPVNIEENLPDPPPVPPDPPHHRNLASPPSISPPKSQEPRAKSQEPRAKSQEPRAKSQEHGANPEKVKKASGYFDKQRH